MADEKWISILPKVFDLLLTGADRIVDDTSIERLLAWLKDVCSTSDGLKMLLRRETGVLTFLSSEKLINKKPCCIGVSFALRLCGILWSNDYDVEDSASFIDLFAKSRENESLWDEAIIRQGYFSGLKSLTVSNEGQKWLQKHKDCLLTATGCISDSSMFVASAARELIAKFIISCWSIRISEQDCGYSSDITWLLEPLQEKLIHNNQPDPRHQRLISDHVVAVLDIVRILLNTNFEAGQEICCVSKLFVKCVNVAIEMADQNVCRKLVDVMNGLQMIQRSQHIMDWNKLLSCVGDHQDQSAQQILLAIPLKWLKKGMITLAVDYSAGLSLPKNTASRCFSAAWPEILACLISAPLEVLMEKPVGNKCNGYTEADTPDIDSLVEDLISLKHEDLDNDIKRVKKQIHKLLEPWMLTKKCQVAILLQVLCTIKDIVTKDASSYSSHMEQWIECSLKILIHSAMVSNTDQNVLAVDVKGNAKVIKSTLSLVTILLRQVLHRANLTDSNREQFFHVLNAAILIARSPRTDPTVITSTLECVSVLLGQVSFLLESPSSNLDDPGVVPACYQRTKEDLGYLIHLRLRDQRWEVKDSALEFVGRLLKLNSGSFPDDVISPSMLSLVWESADDSESYVRSSAWCCIGHLACDPSLWAKLKEKEHLTEFAVLQKMAHVLKNESEAFPRRSVIDCLIGWSRDRRPIVSAVLPKVDDKSQTLEPKLSSLTGQPELKNTDSETRSVFSDIVKFAFKDFDWEVKIRGLRLVETIIQLYSNARKSTQDGELCTVPDPSRQGQSDSHLVALLVDIGAALPLLEAVIDCDSLVCEKALKVISTLKDLDARVSEPNKTESEFQPITNEHNQPITTSEQLEDVIKKTRILSVETFHVILYHLDVSSLTRLCTAGDINVQKDPAGFLEDILVAARDHGDNLLDCY